MKYNVPIYLDRIDIMYGHNNFPDYLRCSECGNKKCTKIKVNFYGFGYYWVGVK